MQATQTALQHVNVKFFLKDVTAIDLADAIHIFHGWIQEQKLDDLLIDVTDYRHVPSGPGVVLIGHNGQYSFDNGEGRLGILYNRKTPDEGAPREVLTHALETARKVCQLLKEEERLQGKLNFATDELQIIVNDRLLAPNTEETLTRLKPGLEAALKQVLGDGNYSFERAPNPRARFSVTIKVDGEFEI